MYITAKIINWCKVNTILDDFLVLLKYYLSLKKIKIGVREKQIGIGEEYKMENRI